MESISTLSRKSPVPDPLSAPNLSDKQQIRNELVLRLLPRINKVARGMARKLPAYVPMDDLVSAGTFGLMDAARKYDPDQCERFEAYADHRIRGSILDELRTRDSLSRDLRCRSRRREEAICKLEQTLGRAPLPEDIADELGIELNAYYQLLSRIYRGEVLSAEALTSGGSGAQYIADSGNPDSFEVAAAHEVHELLLQALDTLSSRLRLVISLYYQEGLKLSEIGVLIGVTEARVCQLKAEAVKMLGEALKLKGVSS